MSKIALVLSGGGMFGAYQAGVWKALSRELAPDIVVGASVGALNGWYIAAGAAPEGLERDWLDPASGDLMRLRKPPLPWPGIFDPRPLEKRVNALVSHYTPRVDYGVALVELARLRRKLARNSEVTWRHLVATCALPGGFPPVRIDGRLYCDGGILEGVPIWAALEMGATRIIAVNALRYTAPVVARALIKSVRWLGRHTEPVPSSEGRGLETVMITPKEPLGKFRDGAIWRSEKIRRWIDLGEMDGLAAMESIRALHFNVKMDTPP